MEHIFAIQSILTNAKDHSLPLSMSFIDLKNVFGSVSHSYITDMLHYIKLPKEISDYIDSLYSSLSGYVSTREWSTPVFNIKRGVFQGDTLSPVLFLILFNPIIQSVSAHPSAGFSLQLQCESQGRVSTPPAKDSFIYAFWSEEGSSEKPGWYLAKVLSIAVDGVASLRYRSGGLFETVQLSSIKWAPAKGNGKWFLPPGSLIPSLPIVEASYSKEHTVKGFADDLTILSRTPTDHQDVLTSIDYWCKEICLCIRPDK